jgi:hypothetical protein
LPSRSMVLKVVTGKILETLELTWRVSACDSDLELRRIGAGAMVKLSKILDYLIDKLYVNMLSPMKEWGQAESGRTEAPLPDLGTSDAASSGRKPERFSEVYVVA